MPSSNTMTLTGSMIAGMEYVSGSFSITSGQSYSLPPTFSQSGSTWTITVLADRSKSSGPATAFINATSGAGHQYSASQSPGDQPSELNFSFGVNLLVNVGSSTVSVPVYFGQGNYSLTNNWWIGGNTLLSVAPVLLQAISNNTVQAIYNVSGSGAGSFTLAPWGG